MAEIKDVYSLEFNSGSFQAEVESAISKVEELNSAMESGADVADDLAAAQNELVSVLGKEAKGVEQLNQKRNVLVNTQKKLNTESKTGVAVSKQLTTTNNQLAVATGTAAKSQRGFVGSLVTGTRAISQMRRVASTLTFVFRGLMSALPFGLIMAAAGPVLDFFSRWWSGVDKTAENMEKLNDKTLSLGERISIAQHELDKLNTIERVRGKLTEEEMKRRKQLEQVYKDTAEEIVKAEQDRFFAIQDLQIKSNRIAIKLRGQSIEAVKENLENERKAIVLENDRRELELEKQILQSQRKERELRAKGLLQEADLEYRTWQDLTNQRVELWKFQTKQIEQLEKESQNAINKIIQDAAKNQKDFEDRILKEERESIKTNQDAILEGTDEFLKEQNALYEQYLEERKKLEEQKSKEAETYRQSVSLKAFEDELKLLEDQLNTASQYRQTNRETQLSLDLLNLEKQRNQELLAAFGNAEEQERIQKDFDKRRAELEVEANREILRIRIDFLKQLRDQTAALDPMATAELNKQIADLELQFEKLNGPIEKVGSDLKGLIKTATEFIQIASDNVFSVLNAQTQAYISALDRAAEKSRETLNDIRQNSENFNARQLELEKERLEKLQAEREKAVEREKTIAQIQVALNAAVTVAKAAAEGGGIASAVTIAAALASLIAGFASARAAAGNAFYHGVEYLERGNNPVGRDTIPARLHEGERVITAADNDKYWDVLTGIHNHRIPADILNGFALGYHKNGLKGAFDMFSDRINLSRELGGQAVFVNVGNNNSGLENRLERIEAVLTDLPKYMPRTVVSANANGIFKIVEQRQRRKNYSSNWSK